MTRIAAAAAHFTRDLAFDLDRVRAIVGHAREAGAELLVLPEGTLGGYVTDMRAPDPHDLPPAIDPDGPEVREVVRAAGELVVCFGFCEAGPGGAPYNAAFAVCGDGVLGRHRKVHQPVGLAPVFRSGDRFTAFDTPVGRMGLLIDHDKTFPEAARTLAVAGAEIIACPSAWPTSLTNRAPRMAEDRQARLFDLYDQARAAENQLVWVSSNLTGRTGNLHFLGRAKIVGPGGDILARTWSKGGLAIADVDVPDLLKSARAVLHHLAERRPETYG
jgi:predicted amidohydrolase